jgi:hypothetical protein
MDIREALLFEHSKKQTMKIVRYIGGDKKKFAELMEHFLGNTYRLSQRAAWAVGYCAERHPELIAPYFEEIADLLGGRETHVAVRRNIARFLQFIEIPEELEGKVYSHCFDLVDDANEPVAVRVFALTVATNIAKKEPDLIPELQLVVRMHLPDASVAFKTRAREILSL